MGRAALWWGRQTEPLGCVNLIEKRGEILEQALMKEISGDEGYPSKPNQYWSFWRSPAGIVSGHRGPDYGRA